MTAKNVQKAVSLMDQHGIIRHNSKRCHIRNTYVHTDTERAQKCYLRVSEALCGMRTLFMCVHAIKWTRMK